jgi:hypothetical protein
LTSLPLPGDVLLHPFQLFVGELWPSLTALT